MRSREAIAADEPRDRALLGFNAAEVISPTTVGHVELDREWRIVRMNAAAATFLDASADVLIGRSLWERRPGPQLDLRRVFETVVSTRQPASFKASHLDSGVPFELQVQPTDIGVDCYFLDMTSRKVVSAKQADPVERTHLVTQVTEALAESLDVRVNMSRLAQLVVPYLGSWSIVTLTDEDGSLVEEHSWHIDPARRDDVRRYAEARKRALGGTLAEQSITTQRPVALMSGAHEAVRSRLRDPLARERLAVLAPQAGGVLPLVARGRTVGVLWLYSDAPWTDHHVEVAKDVAARAALSLDNSLAYARAGAARADAEIARAEAEASGQRLALLVEVSEALAGAGEADDAMARLARLVVPRLADWSLVTIIDDDRGLRDVAVAHRDPSRTDEVAAYAARRALMIMPDTPLAVALRTGEPYVVAEADEANIRAQQPDDDMAQLRHRLDPHGVAVIPLIAGGRTFGALTLVTTRARGGHTPSELSAALEVAQRAGPVLANAQTAQRSRRLAESVQRSLLTMRPPRPGLEISARYRPAQIDTEVGGDWYDHFEVPTGETVLTIGDVMGHDTAAIAAMAQLRTFMRAAAWARRRSPAAVLALTDSVSRTLGPGTFATVITGELDPPSADGSVEFRWSNAGHPPPALITPDGMVTYLDTPAVDVPLGVLADAARHDHTATLQPGSTLVLFTDGLVEQRGRDLEDRFDQLRQVLADAHGPALGAVLDQIVHDMAGDTAHSDDIAVFAVRTATTHSTLEQADPAWTAESGPGGEAQ